MMMTIAMMTGTTMKSTGWLGASENGVL